jgi:hypothetical protein
LDFGIEASGGMPLASWFAWTARFRYAANVLGTDTSAGEELRGVDDSSIASKQMVSLNIDLPFRVVHFAPLEWKNVHPEKASLRTFLKVISFDFQLSPILDIAYNYGVGTESTGDYLRKYRDKDWSWKLYAGGGIEAFVFPLFWRSFYLRVSYAYNLRGVWHDYKDSGVRSALGFHNAELFIGIGHFY